MDYVVDVAQFSALVRRLDEVEDELFASALLSIEESNAARYCVWRVYTSLSQPISITGGRLSPSVYSVKADNP